MKFLELVPELNFILSDDYTAKGYVELLQSKLSECDLKLNDIRHIRELEDISLSQIRLLHKDEVEALKQRRLYKDMLSIMQDSTSRNRLMQAFQAFRLLEEKRIQLKNRKYNHRVYKLKKEEK